MERVVKKIAVGCTAGLLLLVGCGASQSVEATQSATPTPTQATPEQVANVIAKGEGAWRAAIDGAADCRSLWATGGDDATSEAQATTCYLHESAATSASKTAIQDLEEISIPDSMEPLVEDTLAALQWVMDVDMDGRCGIDGSATTGCSTAIGEASPAYVALDTQLAAWSPYLG